MQRVMEVYDLHASKEEQMNEHRAMRLPTTPNGPSNRRAACGTSG